MVTGPKNISISFHWVIKLTGVGKENALVFKLIELANQLVNRSEAVEFLAHYFSLLAARLVVLVKVKFFVRIFSADFSFS